MRIPALVAALCAIPLAAAGAEKAGTPGYGIVIDSTAQAQQAVPEQAAWLAYAAARITALTDREKAGKPAAAGDDFDVELAGRQMLAHMARDEKTGQGVTPYLTLLSKIADAGFLDEYVLLVFARPGWTIPAGSATAFDFDGFAAWRKDNPLGETHPTAAYTTAPNGKRFLDVPGDDLPAPADFKMDHASCAASREGARAALERWASTEAGLNGRPLAGETRTEFVGALRAVAHDEASAKGLTWVSPRPAVLAYLAGYCAVELGDVAGAEGFLHQAVTLRPLWNLPSMELAQVYIMQKKLPEADALIDHALAVTTEKCNLARVYRKRGYLRIDQGRPKDAREAYLKSLDYDPGNKIAESELKVIDQELEKRKELKPGEAYRPPPSNGTLPSSSCPPG